MTLGIQHLITLALLSGAASALFVYITHQRRLKSFHFNQTLIWFGICLGAATIISAFMYLPLTSSKSLLLEITPTRQVHLSTLQQGDEFIPLYKLSNPKASWQETKRGLSASLTQSYPLTYTFSGNVGEKLSLVFTEGPEQGNVHIKLIHLGSHNILLERTIGLSEAESGERLVQMVIPDSLLQRQRQYQGTIVLQFFVTITALGTLFFLLSAWSIPRNWLKSLLSDTALFDQRFIQLKNEWQWIILLCLLVWSFWGIVLKNISHETFIPRYFPCETRPLAWSWIDCEHYFRFTPTGLISAVTFDRYFLSPLLGIEDGSRTFIWAARFKPIFIFLFGVIAVLTYLLSRKLSMSPLASLVSGMFIGLHKGQLVFFIFMSTIALSLMMIYAILVLIFFLGYIKSQSKWFLAGYYLFFILLIGAWEQWVNFLLFIVLYSAALLITRKRIEKAITINGILIPLLLLGIYMVFRYPSIRNESSNITAEAAYVFSYPSISMMAEDMIVNASLHISEAISPLIIPWPRYSQAILHGRDMSLYNPHNNNAGENLSQAHYYTITDWYGALLFSLFLGLTIKLLLYFRKNSAEIHAGIPGLILVYSGCTAHLPIMYRVWMSIPIGSELTGYKHYFSILGASLLLGWLADKALLRIHGLWKRRLMIASLCLWLVFSNYNIMITINRLRNLF